jgi:glyceraldehyde 3-phosphate dehydrogenase
MAQRTRVAINGFGRIGRLVLRALSERPNTTLEVVAINDLTDAATNAHLFQYDSIHGPYQGSLSLETITLLQEKDPSKLPWRDLGVDLVLECSGVFTERAKASKHLDAGAKKVLISAPATDMDLTVVYGVNHDQLKPEHTIVSNASCTTNCLAPLAKIIHETCGIESGFMTTIHAYTGDQRLVDTAHKDLRRARAATLSMIPTSTGAAKAVGLVLPALKGKIDGTAIRVPVPNVSVVDFKFNTERATSSDALNDAFRTAAYTTLKGILDTTQAPLVSVDFNHNPHSGIIDLPQTHVIGGRFGRVLAWYDNEWGFSQRMIDTAQVMGRI